MDDDILLLPGDVFSAHSGMPVLIRDLNGAFKIGQIGDSLLGDYVVEEAMHTHDVIIGSEIIHRGGWFVMARRLHRGSYDPAGAALRFYQTGDGEPLYSEPLVVKRKMRRVYV